VVETDLDALKTDIDEGVYDLLGLDYKREFIKEYLQVF
jgi:hypothetical protein